MQYFKCFSLLMSAVLVVGCGGGVPVAGQSGALSIPRGSAESGATNALLPLGWQRPLVAPHRPTLPWAARARVLATGWTPVNHRYPGLSGAENELLMTDGTVLVHDYDDSDWYALTPDSTGSYINGTWSKRASMPSGYGPHAYASEVLADGKLLVEGGEFNYPYGHDVNLGAIYDPVANKWTSVAAPRFWGDIGDAPSVVLSDGTFMMGDCCTKQQALLDESTMTWSKAGRHFIGTNNEEGWTLLPTGEVLVVDLGGSSQYSYSQKYNPKTNSWSSAGQLPNNLGGLEMGPQVLRPNDTVFVAGADQYTAIYDVKAGTWLAGPDFPKVGGQQLTVADGPATLLTDGSVLIATSPAFASPVQMLVYSGGSTFKKVSNPPNAPYEASQSIGLLILPTGQVLESDETGDVEIYAGASKVRSGIRPLITSVPGTLSRGSTYKISGRRFNGVSQANAFGDENQHATNYPLVRITTSNGNVFYARTHGHSFMGVASDRPVSTMFDVPSKMPTGVASLVVVANGVSSIAVKVTVH